MFYGLSAAFAWYCLMQSATSCCLVIGVISLGIYFCSINSLWVTFISSFCSFLLHLVSTVIYTKLANVVFNRDCEEFRDENRPGTLCAEAGPALLIFLCVLIGIVFIAHNVVSFIVISKKRKDSERIFNPN